MKVKLTHRYSKQVPLWKLKDGIGLLLLLLGVLVLSACSTRESAAYLVKIQLIEGRSHFAPSTLVVPAGSRVIWQNLSIYPVTVTCDPSKVKSVSTNQDPATSAALVKLPSGASPWDSGTLYPGETWSYTFKTTGEYLYFSQYDESPELVGVVRVK